MRIYKIRLLTTKTLYVGIVLLFFNNIQAQAPAVPEGSAIVNTIPKVEPPSPTVAGIMKFEEVPVDNYTGVPDISLPLVSLNTHSKDININLSLNYHPSSIAIDQEASFVGLGWSLNAGGVVSRTVRGLRDEANGPNFGILNAANNYYEVMDVVGNPNATPEEITAFNEYLYDVHERGLYDTEHDLYQYNFFGHIGRFIITNICSQTNSNCYVVEKLDYNDIVDITYFANDNDKYFIFNDDKGYSFKFDVKEITEGGSTTESIRYQADPIVSGSPIDTYISAFHLSEIKDPAGNIIVQYIYHDTVIEEPVNSITNTNITMPEDEEGHLTTSFDYEAAQLKALCDTQSPGKWLEPMYINTKNLSSVQTKKIQTINVIGVGQIKFDLAPRTDFEAPGYCLGGVRMINNKNETVKNLKLYYDYSKIVKGLGHERKRLMLTRLSDITTQDTLSYDLYYVNRKDSISIPLKDYWGYLTHNPEYQPSYDFRETNPEYITTYALQKIKLPTGGAKVIDWGANTYSYIGDTRLEDFSENPFNWEELYETILATPNNSYELLHYSDYDQKLKTYNWDLGPNCGGGGLYTKSPSGEYIEVLEWDSQSITLQGGIQYYMKFSCTFVNDNGDGWGSGTDDPPVNGYGSCDAVYFTRKSPELKYLYGGGIRIEKIGYFDDGDVPKQYYDEYKDDEFIHQLYRPAKEKIYDYNFFNESLRSSGSLVFAKPVFTKSYSKEYQFYCVSGDGLPLNYIHKSLNYVATSDYNRFSPIRTKGADVGYQNVEVYETSNGYSRFTYRSPIDHAEESYTFSDPFIPTPNEDYQRGQLTIEKHFNEAGDILSQTDYDYEFIEKIMKVTGTRMGAAGAQLNAFAYEYPTGAAYVSKLDNCDDSNAPVCNGAYNTWGKPASYITYHSIREACGWARLKSKQTKSYFYDSTGQHAVNTKTDFTYNAVNRKIASQTDYIGDEIMKTNYYYTNLPNNQIGDIQSVRSTNSDVFTGLQYVDYGESGNFNGRPIRFRKSKTDVTGSNAEVMQEVYSYDQWGNILTMSSGPGMGGYKTIIWGYYDTLPIAIIEGGSSFNNILTDPAITTYITTAKNKSNTGTEAELYTALNNLRSHLPDMQVTTYTYKPLVGITRATDSKGYTTYYQYDARGRLVSVKDADGNFLSENQYHYKSAN